MSKYMSRFFTSIAIIQTIYKKGNSHRGNTSTKFTKDITYFRETFSKVALRDSNCRRACSS
jgi:hypothetical protein